MEKSNGNYITRRKFLEISTLGVGSLFVSDFNLNILPTTTQTKSNEIITACNQCYLGCGILAKVIDGRVISLRGQPESPINKGRICAKAHASIYKLYHPERLGYPLMRVGERGEGKWKRITWEKALNIVSKSILKIKNEYAPQSIALWQNTDNDRPDIFQRFIYSLGSPNFLDHTGSVGAPLGTGMALGPVEAIPDYKNAECILIIGANPLGCKQLCWSAKELIQAIHNGAILITVDPRMSETARHSSKGLWLPIKPGTDGILLAGFANYLISNNKYDKNFVNTYTFGFYKIKNYLKQFTVQKVCEKTDIPVNQFMKAVQSMIGKRTVVDILSGASFQPDGAYVGHMRVILSALLGSVDIMGGIIPLPFPRIKYPDVEPLVSSPSIERIDEGNFTKIPLPFLKRPKHMSFTSVNQYLPENILKEKPYPLKAMIICSTNPIYTMPNSKDFIRAFKKLDLIVTIDAFMSETSCYADIVLPGSTYLENIEINDQFIPFKGAVMRKPVVKPRMESISSQNIIIQLARIIGLKREFPFSDYKEFLINQLKNSPVNFNELYHKGFVNLGYKTGESLKEGLLTPSGRIELYSSVLSYSGESPIPLFSKWNNSKANTKYPFYLVSYRLPFHANTRTASNAYLSAIQNENHLLINKKTAKTLNIQVGDFVEIESLKGKLIVRALLTEGIHPQTLALSHHFGHTAYSKICVNKGVRFNDISSDSTDPVSFGITFNDTRVRLSKIK